MSRERSVLVVVIDVTPTVWGERDRHRVLQDQQRSASSKKSIGPAVLDADVLPALITFLTAFGSMERENAAVVVAVAGSYVSVVYPRKGPTMEKMIHDDVREVGGAKIDPLFLNEAVTLGVTELMTRYTQTLESGVGSTATATATSTSTATTITTCSIVAATSLALCIINRFMVACNRGVSALENNLLQRREDQGVLELIAGQNQTSLDQDYEQDSIRKQQELGASLTPRILIIQASDDRVQDYNAFMNCIFAANKGQIIIDACFLPSGITHQAKSSSFLEQACDSTGGIFSKPMGAAQIGGALTQVLMTLFLPSTHTRKFLNLPKVTSVDYRARCFDDTGGEIVDQGFVCNQCLSIFKDRPLDLCLTCGAKVILTQKM